MSAVIDYTAVAEELKRIQAVKRLTKLQLARELERGGMIYPSAAEAARTWSKDELVSGVLRQRAERAAVTT